MNRLYRYSAKGLPNIIITKNFLNEILDTPATQHNKSSGAPGKNIPQKNIFSNFLFLIYETYLFTVSSLNSFKTNLIPYFLDSKNAMTLPIQSPM